jgi:peptidoglycan/xylan/chitin deacetylase (PgdA/CDA1 family)
VLALTFDDGPDVKGLPAVLDVLSYHNIKATFFFNTDNKNEWLGAYESPGNQVRVQPKSSRVIPVCQPGG